MTEAEEKHINDKFEAFGEILDVKLKASQEVICTKMDGLDERYTETKEVIDSHVEWHNSINRRIVGNVVKYGLVIFGFAMVIIFIVGVHNGVIPAVLAKAIG